MKKLFKVVAVAVLSLGLGVAAQAQNGAGSEVMEASANVLGNIEVTAPTALTFGQVLPGFPKYVSMTGNAAASDAVGTKQDVTSGLFQVFAAPGASIALTFSLTTPMTLVGGTDELEIVFNKNHKDAPISTLSYAGTTGPAVDMVFGSANQISVFPTGEILPNRNGINVYVGGTVKPTSTQAPGEYVGLITLAAVYN